MISVTFDEMQKVTKQVHIDSTFKAGYEQSLMRTFYQNRLKSPMHICKEVFMTIPEVFYTKKDFYLLDELNRKIEMMKASGLIEFWSSQNINKNIMNVKETAQPKVLGLSQLKGCFYILFIGLGISSLVFLCEFLIFKITKII